MDDYDPQRNREGGLVPWDSVRSDYEGGRMTCNGIAHRYKLRRGQLDDRACANKWLRPGDSAGIDRRLLTARLLGILERQIGLLEKQMDEGNPAESKVLSDLVRDLDKLIAIERAESRHAGPVTDRAAVSDIRQKLEARINAITKGRG